MRRLALAGGLAALGALWTFPAAEATTFHTIGFNPTNDFAADEMFPTSAVGHTACATWDSGTLYLGILGELSCLGSSFHHMVWYLDTDPQPFPRSGAGTATAIPFGTQNWSLPFFADYAILFKANFGFELRRWNGSAWLPQSLAGVWFYPGCPALYKFGIPLDRFEVPKRIYVVGFSVSDEPSAETTYASWPQDSLVGGDGYKLAGVFAHWFGFALDSGLSPNDPSFHDQTLPVELQSFTVE